MRRIVVVVCLLIALLGASGCTLNQEFVRAVDNHFEVIAPEYVKFVKEDGTLTADDKVIRLASVAALRGLIDAAKGGEP